MVPVSFRRPFLANGDFLAVHLEAEGAPRLELSATTQDVMAHLLPGRYRVALEFLVAPLPIRHEFALDVSAPCEVLVERSGFLRRRVSVSVVRKALLRP